MKSITKNMRSTKYQFTIIILFVIVIFVILNTVLVKLVTTAFLNKNIEYSRTISQKLEREFEILADQNKAIAEFFQYDNDVQKYFLEDVSDDFPRLVKALDNKIFSTQLLYTNVYDLAFVGSQFVNSYMRNNVKLKEIANSVPDDVQVSLIGISEEYWRANYPAIPTLTFCTNIYGTDINFKYKKKIGNIIISINLKKIADQFSQIYNDDMSFILVDSHENYYPINCSSPAAEEILGVAKEQGYIIFQETLNTNEALSNTNSLIYTSYIPSVKCHLISYVSKNSTQKDLGYLKRILIIVSGLTILVIGISFVIVYRKMITPIFAISDYMNRVSSEGYLSIKEKVNVHGNLEITDLANNLNHMMDEINKLTRHLFTTSSQLYETEILQKEAEVSHLRSQINPHFLYNALEAIRGIAIQRDIPLISDITTCLGKMFRYSIKGEPTALFRDELDLLKAYTSIQALRFSQKMRVIYNCPPETMDIPVIKMLLQPILENAIEHAVEPNTKETIIYVASRLEKGDFILTVQDDGCGISEKKLENIQKRLQDSATTRTIPHCIGLVNVHMRIRMTYGEGYGISIQSWEGEGTKVTLRLNAHQNKEEYNA